MLIVFPCYPEQNLESNQRRRDLYQAMTANMESVFGFFLSLLEENYTQYKAHVGNQDSMTAHRHCRVMQVCQYCIIIIFTSAAAGTAVFPRDQITNGKC